MLQPVLHPVAMKRLPFMVPALKGLPGLSLQWDAVLLGLVGSHSVDLDAGLAPDWRR
jgi:hypothetical protein